MDGWENDVRHRNTGGEVERINNLDPVSEVEEKANKYNTKTLHRHTKFMFFPSFKVHGLWRLLSHWVQSLGDFTLLACCCVTFFSLFINNKMIDYYEWAKALLKHMLVKIQSFRCFTPVLSNIISNYYTYCYSNSEYLIKGASEERGKRGCEGHNSVSASSSNGNSHQVLLSNVAFDISVWAYLQIPQCYKLLIPLSKQAPGPAPGKHLTCLVLHRL